MAILEVKLGSNKIQLECENVEHIEALSQKVVSQVDQLRSAHNKVSDTKLVFLVAIMLQEKLDSLQENSNEKHLQHIIDHILFYLEGVTKKLKDR